MPDKIDLDYYAKRASTERQLADAASNAAVAAVHASLAERYERLAAGPQARRATLHIVTG